MLVDKRNEVVNLAHVANVVHHHQLLRREDLSVDVEGGIDEADPVMAQTSLIVRQHFRLVRRRKKKTFKNMVSSFGVLFY